MEQLIIKYLQGNLSLQEQYELSKWLQHNQKNRKILQKLELYWKDHKTTLEEEELEVRRRLLDKMNAEKMDEAPSKNNSFGYLLKIAAVLLLCMTLVMVVYELNYKVEPLPEIALIEKVSLPGQKIATILPDGTHVKLNADSKIIVPSRFSGDHREVTLIGEAFFDVARDESKPFLINTENMKVEVLGTSFNVSAYTDGTPQSISVKTGKVEVVDASSEKSIRLDPLEMVVYKKGVDFQKTTILDAEKAFGWIDQKMVFDNHSIQEVFTKIAKWYGVEIRVNKDLTKNKEYTASYDNPTLKEVMDIVAFVYDFEYEKNGDTIVIK